MAQETKPGALVPSAWHGARDGWQRARQDFRPEHVLQRAQVLVAAWLPTALELGVLALAAMMFARVYLDFDPQLHPGGNDYAMTVQFHSVWLRFRECGLCFFWNGNVNGGGPAFGELFSSSLHPLVAVTTLGWGIVNGTKLALVGMFLMAGIAQWWLARVLGLGLFARMWSGLMAVVAGNIAGRMQMGWFGVALGTAAVALVLPPLIKVALTGSRRAAILLGIALAFAAVAGQGYMQFGLLLILPLVLILLPWGQPQFRPVLRRYGLAIVIALLIGAPFFLPLLQNFGEFTKLSDTNFRGIQPFSLIFLNFVNGDAAFYSNAALNMEPFPALYTNYIGWIAIALALVGIRFGRAGAEARVTVYLVCVAAAAIFLASVEPRQFLMERLPSRWLIEQIGSLRSSPVISGIAVIAILGLAAIGVDYLQEKFAVKLQLALQGRVSTRPIQISLHWILLVPLAIGVFQVALVNQDWLRMARFSEGTQRVVNALVVPSSEWVQPPFGESEYLIASMQAGFKVSKYPFAWGWKDRPMPLPLVLAEGKWEPENTKLVGPIAGDNRIRLFRSGDENEYARVTESSGAVTNCTANAQGGNIDVQCKTAGAGVLTLKENNWAGWNVTVDGQAAALESGQVLGVAVPAGEHTIQFRYRPWSGILGFVLLGLGGLWCIYLWRKPDPYFQIITTFVEPSSAIMTRSDV